MIKLFSVLAVLAVSALSFAADDMSAKKDMPATDAAAPVAADAKAAPAADAKEAAPAAKAN